SNYTALTQPPSPYSNDLRPMSWTDGNPTAVSTDNMNGLFAAPLDNGFSFTAPADTVTRTIEIYMGGWNSGGTLSVCLSDGSAQDFTDVTPTLDGQYNRNYTLSYRAGSDGQTLNVRWKMSSGDGNVMLNAAALNVSSGSVTATAGTPQSTAINTAFATALQATVRDASTKPVSGVTVTFTAPDSGASANFGSSLTATTNSNGVATVLH